MARRQCQERQHNRLPEAARPRITCKGGKDGVPELLVVVVLLVEERPAKLEASALIELQAHNWWFKRREFEPHAAPQ